MKICKHCSKKFSKFADIDKHENACWNNPFNKSYCECCGDVVKHKGKYCNESCAATINNSNRKHSEETKIKISKTLNIFFDKDPRYRNVGEKKMYKLYSKKVHRYSRQQLKHKNPKLYEEWQNNPYTGGGDTSKLSMDHIKPIKYFYDNKLSVQEAGDISNLQIIPYSDNRKRQQVSIEGSAKGGRNNKGKTKSKKHRDAISASLTGKVKSEATKKKTSKSMQGNTNSKNHKSKEYKRKQAQAMREAWKRRKQKGELYKPLERDSVGRFI